MLPNDNSFRGITLSYIVSSDERVDAIREEAQRAGGTVVKAGRRPSGGVLRSPQRSRGYLWKVAVGGGRPGATAE